MISEGRKRQAALAAALLALVVESQAAPGGKTARTAAFQVRDDLDGYHGVEIESFTDDVTRPLKAGDTVTATLRGTRGAKVSFAIPGVTEGVSMRETSPGFYTGTYTVPKNVAVVGGAVVGRLTLGNVTPPLVAASGGITIDAVAPRVTSQSPSKGAMTADRHPLLFAALSDAGGVGVDPRATKVSLDGQDVTAQATVTPWFLHLTPAMSLGDGGHTVRVAVADKVGNATTTGWSFTVTSNAPVQSFASSAPTGKTFGPGETIRFTLKGTPGGRASVDIPGIASGVPLGEGTPGVYTGEYTTRPGDNAPFAPVSARFEASGHAVTALLPTGLTIAAGGPRAPRITFPPDDVIAGEIVPLEGIAPPGATVRLSVDYVSKALGGQFAIAGSAGSRDVTANGKGQWRVDSLPLRSGSLLGRDRDTAFTVSAVTVAAGGDVSKPTIIHVRRG